MFVPPLLRTKTAQTCLDHIVENVLDIFHIFIRLVNFYQFIKTFWHA